MSVTTPTTLKPVTAAPAHPEPNPFQLLWRALNSLPVAIGVMVALALLCAIGTMIPQAHLAPQPPGQTFEQFLTDRYGAQKFHLLHLLGFDHVYFTWYFGGLLAWLACSAVICNIVRFRTTLKLWRTPQVKRGVRFFLADRRSVNYSAAAVVGDKYTAAAALADATAVDAAQAIRDDLKLLGYRVRSQRDGEAELIYADRGFTKKWGLVALHFAILVLLFGGMYGAAVGTNGTVRLADGEKQTLTIDSSNTKYPWLKPVLSLLPKQTYELHQHKFSIDWGRKLVLESDLEKNVPAEFKDYFYYYVDDYVSDLEAAHGKYSRRGNVVVNHPLVLDKLVLYQSGYEQRGYVAVTGPDGKTVEHQIPQAMYGDNTWFGITKDALVVLDPNTGRWFVPLEVGEDIKMQYVPEGTPVSNLAFSVQQNVKSGDLYKHHKKVGQIGPMALFSLRDNNVNMEMGNVLINQEQGFDPNIGGQLYHVRLAPRVDDFSVFAYKLDPGSPILFLGWILMVAGIALTMYIPFSQVWVRAEAGTLHVLALGREGGHAGRLRRRVDAILGLAPSS